MYSASHIAVYSCQRVAHACTVCQCERVTKQDDRLRDSFLKRTAAVLQEAGASPPTVIADLGCSTGLSTLAIAKAFPSAATIQVSYSIAVALTIHTCIRARCSGAHTCGTHTCGMMKPKLVHTDCTVVESAVSSYEGHTSVTYA
jgi:hypothetical protein